MQNMKARTKKQEQYYNKAAKDLPPLQEGDGVRAQPLVQGENGPRRL